MFRRMTACVILGSCMALCAQSQHDLGGASVTSAQQNDANDQTDYGRAQQIEQQEQQQLQLQRQAQEQQEILRQQRAKRPDWSHGHDYFPNTQHDTPTPDPVGSTAKSCSAAGGNAVSSFTKSINPDDVNYGGLLSAWNRRLVEDAILRTEFWGNVLLSCLVILLLLYVYWLRMQREERYRITVDIARQLLNGRRYARFYANRVIAKHNELVGSLNDEHEARLRGEDSVEQTPEFRIAPMPALSQPAHPSAHSDARGINDVEPVLSNGSLLPIVAANGYSMDIDRPVETKPTRASVDDILANANATAIAESKPEPVVDNSELEELRNENKALKMQTQSQSDKINNLRSRLKRKEMAEGDAE